MGVFKQLLFIQKLLSKHTIVWWVFSFPPFSSGRLSEVSKRRLIITSEWAMWPELKSRKSKTVLTFSYSLWEREGERGDRWCWRGTFVKCSLLNYGGSPWLLFCFQIKILFIYFLERGEGREKEIPMCERYIHPSVASRTPPAGDLACNQECVVTGNWTSDLSVPRWALNLLSHTS